MDKGMWKAAWDGFVEGVREAWEDDKRYFWRHFWWMFIVSLVGGIVLTLMDIRL